MGDCQDDLLLRVGENGLLWLIEGSRGETARGFAETYRELLQHGHGETDGQWVVAHVGEVARQNELLAALMKH